MAARPRARMIRVLGAASSDTVRWSLAIVPMAAVAFAGPWAAMFEIDETFHPTGPEPLILLVGAMFVMGGAMQSLLLELGAGELKPGRARWRFDVWSIARRLGIDLGLNLVALALTSFGASLVAILAGVAAGILIPHGDAAVWAALGGGVLGGMLVTGLLARWSIAVAAAHVEGLGIVEALHRSAELTGGHRPKIAAAQAVYMCAWPALITATFYVSEHAADFGVHRARSIDEVSLELAFGLLGVLAGYECFAKTRLYREVATLDGEVGQARVLEVFN